MKGAKMPTKITRTISVIFTVIFIPLFIATHDSQAVQKEEAPDWNPVEKDPGPIHLTFNAYISYGSVSGFTQAGLGGAPGTGSPDRPKIKTDLGINDSTTGNLSLELGWKQHNLDMAAHLTDLKGENSLDRTLVFHGKTYLTGIRIESEIKSNWYEVAYRFRFPLGQSKSASPRPNYQNPFSRDRFTIAPTVAMAIWDFSAQLQQSGLKNERSYSHLTPRLGVVLEWNPLPKFSLVGNAIGSIPINGMVHIYTLGLTAEYNLVQRNSFSIGLGVGVGYDHIDFKDSQTFPNKVRIDMGPMVMGGLKVKF